MPEDNSFIRNTQCWVDSVIVDLNFCPFARREIEKGRVHYQVSYDVTIEPALHTLIGECERLNTHHEIETTLLIYADGFKEFGSFLELLEIANQLLIEQGYEGVYQIASFHPDYCFEGELPDDAANYTNRSPYPVLHLIREASIERALENYPEPESIPERNIKTARNKGVDIMKQLLEACRQDREG